MSSMTRRRAKRLHIRKQDVIRGLGGSVRAAADKLGITVQAVYRWPDPLSDRLVYQAIGACVVNAAPPVRDQVIALLFPALEQGA